ncbi:MAG TPA: beta-fructosidase [Cyanobacteria bacterium UBA11149]|nr:beta-fructosidase [Cyanobacteria bacterium UBA11367]HBE59563.1 beta-fructosidase [Cyanobacteria bacterium UBA11366]HBK65531.1 beta-fructosidase [Cyanobacteria bacterium UBA11166]HBR75140.1 beta-fructosidase [Cyanobacteria bacterium UBA11159]HBS68063.1 beta-fructosidase [Cyanobacteria bacterium UBA11153]HBW89799.1 beta-fructosidase [Cyanobacteria bacterium UBA11149]HCA95914.1 beta-fructosidase [Cyanobacteria bacterium UBA9226]
MFPSMRHPSRHVWDFWYYFDSASKLFHIFYLNADEILVSSDKHHFASCVGHATTSDFIRMDWGNDRDYRVLTALPNHWANTSIWSGDIIKVSNGFLLFYTSRNREQDDGMTQNIGIAYSSSISTSSWQLSSLRIEPGFDYLPKNLQGDLSTHAWRDPFIFRENNQIYMLLSAKSTQDPIGRNGVIGCLRLKDRNFREWEYLQPIAQPSCYSEMEVPQLYKDPQGNYELVFSSWAKNDFSPFTRKSGGFQGLTASNLKDFSNQQPHVLMSEKSGLYACRIIPEMDGEIVGFDIQDGGIRRSGVRTNFQEVDRNFTDFTFEM